MKFNNFIIHLHYLKSYLKMSLNIFISHIQLRVIETWLKSPKHVRNLPSDAKEIF